MKKILGSKRQDGSATAVLAIVRRFAWGGLLLALLLLPAAAQQPVPPREPEPEATPKITGVQLRKEKFNELKKESERLQKTAQELQKAIDKPGDLPRALIAEKAAEIEKHAKRIHSKLIGF